jgi:2-keto-3-deoxy-L-rhamnonate aldolase RhmA
MGTLPPRSERIPAGLRRPGTPTFGTWVKLATLETMELLAEAGFEFVVVDLEHSPLTLESAYTLCFAAQHLGMTALVRVADRSGNYLQRVLDSGFDGVLVPQVTSVAEAEAAVAGMTFSPAGRRGAGSTSRAGRWGLDSPADYRAKGDSIVRGIQIEDIDSLRAIEPILDVVGLGAAFLGMGDLTMSTGLAATDPELVELTDHLLAETGRRGMPCGTAVGDAAAAAKAAERGFSFVMVSNDTSIFANAAAGLGRAVREVLAPLR